MVGVVDASKAALTGGEGPAGAAAGGSGAAPEPAPMPKPKPGGEPAPMPTPPRSRPSVNVRSTLDPLADSRAKRIVLVSVLGTGILTGIASVQRGNGLPPAKVVGGVVVSGVLLATLAEFQPRLAAGLAGLMLITAAVGMGDDAWKGVNQAVTRKAPKPSTTSAGGGGGSPMRPA